MTKQAAELKQGPLRTTELFLGLTEDGTSLVPKNGTSHIWNGSLKAESVLLRSEVYLS